VNRKHRIVRETDFKRVRDEGKSTAHPLIVLITADGTAETSRAGIITSKSIGKAAQRNRVRRQLRAILSSLMPKLKGNVDMIIIARKAILNAEFCDIRKAVVQLLVREKYLEENDHT
jgi:ribonuclease P protein component